MPKCCTHYHLVNGSCKECTSGYFGSNCTPCRFPAYGLSCRSTCHCLENLCNHKIGCLESEQSTTTTAKQIIFSTEDITFSRSRAITTFTSRELSVIGLITTAKPVTSSGDVSMTSVIIIIGSVLCFFLFLIAANQIHSKIQRQRLLVTKKQRRNKLDPSEVEDVYQIIEESQVSATNNKYNVVSDQSRLQSLASPASKPEYVQIVEEPIQNLSYDSNSAEINDITKILEAEDRHKDLNNRDEIRKDPDCENKETLSGPTSPTACLPEVNVTNTDDTYYCEPITQHNTYLDVIQQSRDPAYIDVVHE
ncbi:uncharacterized protein LOC133196046 [Saccostrea echinata]|uniref:uncharacterized protein LOC133196046 n=1 Tax=Saccostrea echinata TaxID=191078 RepID=UPI002A8091ED|nr:uncharacterized protein LOC133196046 [Saccostrea echinata]